MTPRRKPYGCVFCPMFFCFWVGSALIQLDVDVANALLDHRRATLRAGTPAAEMRVRALVDGGLADEQRIDVDARIFQLGVGQGAGQELLEERRTRFGGELEELKRLGSVAPADQVDDHARLARTDPLVSGCGGTDHDDSFLVRLVDPLEAANVATSDNRLSGPRFADGPGTGPHRTPLVTLAAGEARTCKQ